MQPLLFGSMVILLPLLAYSIPALLLNWPLPHLRLQNRKEQIRLLTGITLLILANWAYLIIKHT